jgi:hypothetical protein
MALAVKQLTTARVGMGLVMGPQFRETGFFPGAGQAKLLACAMWDDSIDGHLPAAVSKSGMGLGVYIPALAGVIHTFLRVGVVPVGPTNMGLSLEEDSDLIADAAISGAPWHVATATANVLHGAVAREDTAGNYFTTKVVTTVAREIKLYGTVAASTAGRVAFYVEYVPCPSATQGAYS